MTPEELVEEATNDPRANPWEREFVLELVEKARREALEQAAKVADEFDNGDLGGRIAERIAAKIRELAPI